VKNHDKTKRVKLNYGTLNDKDVATLGVAVVDGTDEQPEAGESADQSG